MVLQCADLSQYSRQHTEIHEQASRHWPLPHQWLPQTNFGNNCLIATVKHNTSRLQSATNLTSRLNLTMSDHPSTGSTRCRASSVILSLTGTTGPILQPKTWKTGLLYSIISLRVDLVKLRHIQRQIRSIKATLQSQLTQQMWHAWSKKTIFFLN